MFPHIGVAIGINELQKIEQAKQERAQSDHRLDAVSYAFRAFCPFGMRRDAKDITKEVNELNKAKLLE